MTYEQVYSIPKRCFIKLSSMKKKEREKSIEKYVTNTYHTFHAKDVAEFVVKDLEEQYPVWFIRKFMKRWMNLSYKKIKPRPNNIDLMKLDFIRSLFAVKLANSIDEQTLIINLDQSSINRNIKTNRSWGLRGAEIEWKNSNFVRSTSMWMAILSNGAWYWLLTNETITSDKIILFLNQLSVWINNKSSFGFSDVLLILDNWSIQKSSEVKKLMVKLNWVVMYLPVYTQIYAPIENWFGLIKTHMKNENKSDGIKINLKQNFDKIFCALKSIKSQTIKNLFAYLFSRIREKLTNLSQ